MGTVRQTAFGEFVAGRRGAQPGAGGMILMVGEPQRMQTLKKHFPERSGVFFIEFSDLTPEILHSICPDSVISPAISDQFDCLDLADFLSAARYKGAYRVLARDLPRPEIIRNELRSHYPGLDFDVLRPEPIRVLASLH
ncbi:hypothetical protein [Celeribacter ethanolicus]|uniref:Uncharacterized protein n=1 Tax=Celeribacter ethanolicus TaxID=1758178 RepID=A0A291G989_9RHOB|nr:hypothetical protein [Celeribacter ethanolicus]ATG46727.1 hypothetical protein CEW89_03620 [Celeribacter ethanolicus]TNE66265.1 MAG: hypothetical protein EP336_10335 [Paracoccaceae bacterium]